MNKYLLFLTILTGIVGTNLYAMCYHKNPIENTLPNYYCYEGISEPQCKLLRYDWGTPQECEMVPAAQSKALIQSNTIENL